MSLGAGVGIAAFLLTGCASGGSGTVTGTFEGEAGPVSASGQAAVGPWPLSGVVRFTDANGHRVEVTVGAAGTFSVRLAPGQYRVAGVTSEMGTVDPNSDLSQPPCGMQNMDSTLVRAGQADRMTLICYGP